MIERLKVTLLAALAWWIDGLWLGVPERPRGFFERRPQHTVRLAATPASVELAGGSDSAGQTTVIALDDPNPADKVGPVLAAAPSRPHPSVPHWCPSGERRAGCAGRECRRSAFDVTRREAGSVPLARASPLVVTGPGGRRVVR